MNWVDVAGWLLHFAVIGYSWRYLVDVLGRSWRPGPVDATWALQVVLVLATFLLPVVSVWAVLPAWAYRRGLLRRQVEERQAAWVRQRAADVDFWRDQLKSGDPVAVANARELLAAWGVDPNDCEVQYAPHPHGTRQAFRRGCRCPSCVQSVLSGCVDYTLKD